MSRAPNRPLTQRERGIFAAYLVTLLIITVAAACGGCAGRFMAGDVPSASDPSVARLVVVKDGKEEGFCTVFKVGEDLAMTAGHCCGEDHDEVEEMINDLLGVKPEKHVMTYHATGPHAVYGAAFTVLHDDDKHDVCLMRGKLLGAPLALAAHDPALGSRVWTAGYPKTELLFSDGLWSGRDDDGDSKASVAVWGGASGSPVMDGDGRVVGVLRAFYPPMSNFSLIAPLEWLRAAMSMAR
jgi:V8-like Glu-specific endopeptidase